MDRRTFGATMMMGGLAAAAPALAQGRFGAPGDLRIEWAGPPGTAGRLWLGEGRLLSCDDTGRCEAARLDAEAAAMLRRTLPVEGKVDLVLSDSAAAQALLGNLRYRDLLNHPAADRRDGDAARGAARDAGL